MKGRGIFAFGLALATGTFIYLALRAHAENRAGGKPVKVLIARESIESGTRLTKAQLAEKSVPEAYVHQEAIRAVDAKQVFGRPLSNTVRAGQPILWTDLTGTVVAGARTLSSVVGKGLRALTVPVDISASLGGHLRPGDRVDVMGTFQQKGGLERTTVTLLQNVTVLATGSKINSQDRTADYKRGYGHITVSVSLEEAELLAFSMSRGSLHAVLRNAEDIVIVENVPEKNFNDIFEPEKRKTLQRKRKPAIERLTDHGAK